MANAGKFEPRRQGDDWTGCVGRAAADLNLAPAGLAAQAEEHALVEDLDPAAAVLGLVAAAIQANDLGAAQAAGKAQEQHGAVTQAPQRAAVERLQHRDQILGQHRLLLPGRRGVGVADAGHHGRDMPVLAVERLTALGIVPGERGQPALDRRHRVRPLIAGRRARGAGRDVKPDNLRVRRKTVRPPAGGTRWKNAANRRR